MHARRAAALLLAAAAVLASGAPARAADPGRWKQTGLSRIPFMYYQGVTSDDRGHFYFDGIFVGLYRADTNLAEQARNDDVIPPAVSATEGYNHMGDLTYDRAEGGRVLLPMECYYPGTPGDANTCHTGSLGVANPATLAWRYYVKLDPAEIPKAMWAEVSPDGTLVWTSAGQDLLAYRTADITPANAAPAGPVIHAVRRLPGAVPPSGITGAAFRAGRLFVAGQQDDLFQVWSIDLTTGTRRLEIERQIAGESEGLDFRSALGGQLHWLITPVDPQHRPPTYGTSSNVLLHFVPVGSTQNPVPNPTATLRITSVRPRSVVAGRSTRVRVRVTMPGARVRIGARRARADAHGLARLTVRPPRPGALRVVARKGGRRAVSLLRVRPAACTAAHAQAAC
jgi:hypothetical protein